MKKKWRRLPVFPSEVNKFGRNEFLTKHHIRSFILSTYPDLAEEYCIFRRYNTLTGEIERKYAWHSIFEILNSDGRSEFVINTLLNGYREETE